MADLSKIENTIDVYGVNDFKPNMPVIRGRTALSHRLCRRLQTRRGAFLSWPNDGTDITEFLLSKAQPSTIAAAAEAECLKDEQVLECTATAEYIESGRRIALMLEIQDSDGPFTLTLMVDDARLNLVSLEEAT